jgi:hypothetical protein
MTPVKKLTLGLQPANKTFRVDSMWGDVLDALLDSIGNELPDTYYTQIGETRGQGIVTLINEKEGNFLQIDRQNVAFTKDKYDGHVNLDETFSEFKKIWGVIQNIVKFKDIRRIGLVAEYRFETAKNNNLELINLLTKLPNPNSPAHFSLHYENRIPTNTENIFDIKTSGFTNIIYDFYDSAIDSSHPVDGKINTTFDYQKYFTPTLNKQINKEMDTHFYSFKKELMVFETQLVTLGLKK